MTTELSKQAIIEDIARVATSHGVPVNKLPRALYRKHGKYGDRWEQVEKSWRGMRTLVSDTLGLAPKFTARALSEDVIDTARKLGVEVSRLSRAQYLEHGQYRYQYESIEPSWTKVKEAALRDLEHPPISDDEWSSEDTVVEAAPPHVDRYVLTYAQNATPIDDNFFASLLNYCKYTGSKLVVLPGRYRNPTSIWKEEDKDDDWWDTRLMPYLQRERVELCESLIAYNDISIQPTAIRPLTGFEVFAGAASAIFGHPKFQLKSVAAHERGKTRTLATTGAVTIPNYTDSKAGKKGHAHHIQGALAVEVCENDFFLRQLNAHNGSFIDLDKMYTPQGVEDAPRPLALVMGDVHVSRVDPNVVKATLTDKDAIVKQLNPEKVILHDLVDFQARNHHSINDPNERFARMVGEQPDSVEDEIFEAIEFVDSLIPEGVEPVVIPSNHDEAFDRWLVSADPRCDPKNARFFHEVRGAVLRHYEEHREWVPAFELVYKQHGNNRAYFPRRNESYMVGGINCGFHGDKGLNGSRASTLAYSKLGVKTVIGHSHSPAILEGAYQVGVSGNLDMGYNSLPSSWMHAHCVIYANSKRSLLFIKGDRWKF